MCIQVWWIVSNVKAYCLIDGLRMIFCEKSLFIIFIEKFCLIVILKTPSTLDLIKTQ